MAKYTRITGKVFGSSADPTGNVDPTIGPTIGQFGSALAGSYTGTSDIATIQSLPAWQDGFISAVTPNTQFPPLPEMTGFGKVLSYQLCYLLQQGIPEYDNGTTYYTGNWVSYNSSIYVAKVDNFSNIAPTDTTKWNKFTGAGARNLGEYVTSSLPLTDDTLHLADGSLLTQTDYPEFYSYVANLYNSLPTGEFSQAMINSTISGYDWRGIASNGNILVAVSYEGYFSKSTNGGQTWSTPSKNGMTLTEYVAVTYGDGCFIAITVDGLVAKSTDNGDTWVKITGGLGTGSTAQWSSIAYGKGRFIAVGEKDYYSISIDDGESWSSNTWTSTWGTTLNGTKRILFENNQFVILCHHSTQYSVNVIITSPNGVFPYWTMHENPWIGNKTFVALASDGANLYAITANGYVAKGSFDGLSWQEATQNANLGNNSWTSAIHAVDKVIAISSTSYMSKMDIPSTNVFLSEADWQAEYTTYGECGKYVYNSGANTVRIPAVNSYFTNTTNAQTLGDVTPASIPNIKGVISANEKLYKTGTSVSDYGAFNNVEQNVVSGQSDNSHFDNDLWDFDASRVSSVYSDSATTVNTQSIKQLVYIVVKK